MTTYSGYSEKNCRVIRRFFFMDCPPIVTGTRFLAGRGLWGILGQRRLLRSIDIPQGPK